jgi:uncharacterized membrane protein YjfL (UPF0719 family)
VKEGSKLEFNVDAAIGFIVAIIQLIIGLIVGVAAIYLGIRFVDKMTENIEELAELKKGNVSVGIFMFAVIITFATVLQSGVEGLTTAMTSADSVMGYLWAVVVGIIQLIVSIVIAVLAIYMALNIIQKVSEQINKMKVKGLPKMKFTWEDELIRDNKAFAVFIAGILIGISFVIQAGVGSIASSLADIVTF